MELQSKIQDFNTYIKEFKISYKNNDLNKSYENAQLALASLNLLLNNGENINLNFYEVSEFYSNLSDVCLKLNRLDECDMYKKFSAQLLKGTIYGRTI